MVVAAAMTGCAGEFARSGDAGSAEAGRACIQGTLGYVFADAEFGQSRRSPAPASTWELKAAPGEGSASRVVAQGVTDEGGRFSACTDSAVLHAVSIRFFSEHRGVSRVVPEADDQAHPYSFTTGPIRQVEGTIELGDVSVPAEMAGAWRVVAATDLLYRLRESRSACWSSSDDEADGCEVLPARWPAPADASGYWDSRSGYLELSEEDVASWHVLVHESGHWWQNALYGGEFPIVDGCEVHYVDEPSSESCAWTEGFADAVSGWVLGGREFVHSDGSADGFQREDGAPWPGAERTQGNVAAALLDLWRLDGPDGTWDANIRAMTGNPSTTVREYMTQDRPDAGLAFDSNVADLLRRHGIDLIGG